MDVPADSARIRPLITLDSGHPLRSIPATYYGDLGHPKSEKEATLDKSNLSH
jgi:hypothetical protein